MIQPHRGSRGRWMASAAAGLLLAGGIGTIGAGLAGSGPTPAGTSSQAATAAATIRPGAAIPAAPSGGASGLAMPASGAAGAAPPSAPAGLGLPASLPLRLSIPAIGVESSLLRLGKQPDGEVAVPPGEPGSPAGWYEDSPTPGQDGSAVILGHVNAIGTPIGVFYRLHELTPGQEVTVARADGTAAVFSVDRVDTYPKSSFPTVEVYRNADRPELRLITCGGFDSTSGTYVDNTVVYAHLVSAHPA